MKNLHADILKPFPFLKWAGGKRQLVKILSGKIPHDYNKYFEPFVGAGALFFELEPKEAYISDINPELINVYNVVKNNVNDLINELSTFKYDEETYYKIRDWDRSETYDSLSNVQKASRFIFLNRTCFNGLYRVNSKGYFNVPFGAYENPKILDAKNLRNCSRLLKHTEIKVGSFSLVEEKVQTNDFVYFDPPYIPVSKTSSFTKYFKDDFNFEKQIELKNLFSKLTSKGVFCMLSNSYTDEVLELYDEFKENIFTVSASRVINCKAAKRGKIKEVIITNYTPNLIHDIQGYRKRLSA